ncbi:peptidylprolyl isomerase [Erythrobacter sp. QSSC1-22B]|uniref:peptidylprolyl isomerase n=1 Tax=Erythrobacter sp. QSSC1-22B TaxID=1860125 RepID=UPI0008056225|nr:peptidylprolyl isomerase [Erythrobacter sp. QSSC1-22B]OBX17991.1 peptidylprolyl isomerase [Erythrobacter sp. QSSC1-22B]
MIRTAASALAALALTLPLAAQEAPAPNAASPGEIVAAATPQDWTRIAPDDLLVMVLAPAADGTARDVVIQLMPPPFSQGWVDNIRTLARAGWYDGISINRVQDNYVVQWGDPNHDNPEADGPAKPLPEGLRVMEEGDYVHVIRAAGPDEDNIILWHPKPDLVDSYAGSATFDKGWPIGIEIADRTKVLRRWPVHCYGMVGVGRGYSPDAGSGAELYTVIGHAPRHLDRNIALVGRVVEGIEHLSSLPRGKGALGFYEDPAKRIPIRSIRIASDLPASEQPRFEYLSTESEAFGRYAEARANRRDPFFIAPAGGADICNIPVPVRRVIPAGE